MNIQTIKKFKKEFDAFLEDESVYVHFKNGGHRNVCTLEDFGTQLDYCYIDDEYAEFRKALAEGKTIQYNPKISLHNRWDDVKPHNGIFSSPPENYRIKPEEPKFKVGYWIINLKPPFGNKPSAPFLVTKDWLGHIDRYGVTCGGNTHLTGELENFIPWEPTQGDWCWFFNNNDQLPRLGRFLFSDENGIFQSSEGYGYWGCEPFIGQLPTNLK